MDNSERFWNSTLEELKRGYIFEHEHFVCLLCGTSMEKGVIYSDGNMFYEAEKYMRVHMENSHGSVFEYLIQMDKRLTGLTDHQKSLLHLFGQGKSDKEIQQELGIGSGSTIRNHRFVLKEKERQAKLFLAMMELLKEKDTHAPAMVDIHQTAQMVDERYNITRDENDKIVGKYFPDGSQGALKAFPTRQKQKLIVLREIARRFQAGHTYSEKEINDMLQEIYSDYVTVRRYLVDYGFWTEPQTEANTGFEHKTDKGEWGS